MSALAPLVIHHFNPATLTTIGVAAVSSAGVVAAFVGSWFTRMERVARAEGDPSAVGPRRQTAQQPTQEVTVPEPAGSELPLGHGGLSVSG